MRLTLLPQRHGKSGLWFAKEPRAPGGGAGNAGRAICLQPDAVLADGYIFRAIARNEDGIPTAGIVVMPVLN